MSESEKLRIMVEGMSDVHLRTWCESTVRYPDSVNGEGVDMALAGGILRLLAENAALRKQVEGHCERIAKQSELLSRKAEMFVRENVELLIPATRISNPAQGFFVGLAEGSD